MSYASTLLALSPIAYWRLGEASGMSAADGSGNGHGGTYVGAPTLGATGLLTGDPNTAITLGTGKYVSTPTSAAYDIAHPAVVAWTKGSGYDDFQQAVSQSDATTAEHWYLCFRSSGRAQFTVVDGIGANGVASPGFVDDGTRHMIVGRYDGAFLDLFIDGTRVGHIAYTGTMNIASGIPVTIGAKSDGSLTATLPLTIDEVALFDASVLTDTAIADLWTAGSTAPNTASGSLTLGGAAGAFGTTASGVLALGGSAVPPVITHGSLTLGSPGAAARPVYLAAFTVDIGMEASDIPLLPADTPTVDYVGDDDSDLVDYPDPTLDQWGRPIAS